MPGVTETIGTKEQVIHLIRREGEMPRPDDMRCEATVEGKDGEEERCSKTKSLDQDNGNWLRWCQVHAEKEAKARVEGGERVKRFEGESDEGEDE